MPHAPSAKRPTGALSVSPSVPASRPGVAPASTTAPAPAFAPLPASAFASVPATLAGALVGGRAAAFAVAMACGATAAHASDARVLGLGGSAVASGRGVAGALANPAALMDMQRRGERVHVGTGITVELRDDAGLVDIATDDANDDLASDTEDEIDRIDATDLVCDPATAARDTVCLDGLSTLSRLSGRALDIVDSVGDDSTRGQAVIDAGVAFTGTRVPFALHLQARATGRGRARVSDGDREYFAGIQRTLEDDVLTLGEIDDSPDFAIDPTTNRVDVRRPEDVLTSTARGGYATRVTLGASLATSFEVGGRSLDVGVTPKFSSLLAQGTEAAAAEEFADGAGPLEDRLDASEASESSFTFDVGVATTLASAPLRLAAVLRNVVPESVESRDGVVFDTTPQLVVGGVFDAGRAVLSADVALNEAELDSLPTQVLAFGAETALGPVTLRAGLNHEAARDEAPTALTLGAGLGPLQLGVRLAAAERTQAALGLAFSF